MTTLGFNEITDSFWLNFLKSVWMQLIASVGTEVCIEVHVYVACWICTTTNIESSKGQLHPMNTLLVFDYLTILSSSGS